MGGSNPAWGELIRSAPHAITLPKRPTGQVLARPRAGRGHRVGFQRVSNEAVATGRWCRLSSRRRRSRNKPCIRPGRWRNCAPDRWCRSGSGGCIDRRRCNPRSPPGGRRRSEKAAPAYLPAGRGSGTRSVRPTSSTPRSPRQNRGIGAPPGDRPTQIAEYRIDDRLVNGIQRRPQRVKLVQEFLPPHTPHS